MHTFFFSKKVATPKIEGVITMAKAHVGDIIEFKDGLTGIVEKLNENSVIVDLTYMENFKDLGIEEKTVVNHKNYQIIHSVEEDHDADEEENEE
ncbi:YkvS family protein [Listeria welshimeri]|uniref:YkvS family protein n=1 Tax=Listeria welshimeri TaxID=1643 RepID=UPI0016265562|nr:YkvS family protein [Listeria welshimeri]MBC1602454.1 YkvS family protein [Listeria welshimeri]MBC1654605.1 YkvS family protein [Listeria welshimeri]MBC1949771.1 YkvS family protein [Listeria welshimeri]MBC6126741.1 YkvS family protein [Listeria welshimeri]MBF2638889.1 YkvS family protein [Listeria welshimeri]